MEDDKDKIINSPFFDGEKFRKQIELIKDAATKAQEIIDYSSAHDEDILRAIDIVESFLRKKHRLCYGGQAINEHLPLKHKIYDPTHSIPDYDFFTPEQAEDIRILGKELRKNGFTEISAREGMHEGTIKLYVNYVPVADLTKIDKKLYNLLSKREFRSNGISYLDANTLRMLMYLELSRPRGQVSRWDKVYERLMLLNEYVQTPKVCKKIHQKGNLTESEVNAIMDYLVKEKRIFAGADLLGLYRGSFHGKRRANWLLYTKKPIFMYTSDLEKDTEHFKYEFRHITPDQPISVHKIQAMGGDLIPQMSIFLRNNVPIFLIISQNACHSYYNVPLKYENTMRIASLDTLITLYFSLALLKYKYLDLESLECLGRELIEISIRARENPSKFPFPFLSLECSGHQKRITSLIREKVKRIKT